MPSKSSQSIFLWIKVTIAILVGSAVVLFGMNVFSVVDRVDQRAHLRDVGGLKQALFLMGEATAAAQLAVAVRDEAYEQVVRKRNRAWMRSNLGRDVRDPSAEQLLVVAGDGEILFSSRADQPVGRSRADDAATAAAAVIERARLRYQSSLVETDGGFTLALERDGVAVPGIYDHDLAVVDGLPAVITAVAVISDLATSTVMAGTPTTLVHVRHLEGKAKADLATMAQLDDVSLAPLTGAAVSDGPGRSVIANRAGTPVALATWNSARPGSAVVAAMAPTLVLSALLIALMASGGSGFLARLATRLAKREEEAEHAARHDQATGLANRAWFHQRTNEAMDAFSGGSARLGVVLVDLDYFKQTNDTLGHAAGDAVILAAAERMKLLDGETVITARLGGDEFALVTRPMVDAARLDAFCHYLHEQLVRPVLYEGHEIPLSASIGAALFPTDGHDSDSALLAADRALYRAKGDGRGCFRIYDRTLDGVPGETVPGAASDPEPDTQAAA